MQKFIPRDKLSKKAKRQLDSAQRKSWGGISPVTRKPDNPKAYNRNKDKTRRWKEDIPVPGFVFAM